MYDLPQMEGVSKVIVDGAVVRGEAKPYLLLASNDESEDEDNSEADFRRAASDE